MICDLIKFNALFIWVSSYVSPSKADVLARHFRRLSGAARRARAANITCATAATHSPTSTFL